MTAPELSLHGIACTFTNRDDPAQRYTAVRDVSLTVGAGELTRLPALSRMVTWMGTVSPTVRTVLGAETWMDCA